MVVQALGAGQSAARLDTYRSIIVGGTSLAGRSSRSESRWHFVNRTVRHFCRRTVYAVIETDSERDTNRSTVTNIDELSTITDHPYSDAVSRFRELIETHTALAFLIGAGCSKYAGLPLTTELTNEVLASTELNCTSKIVLSTLRDCAFAGANNAHIEDYLSEMVDLLAIADRRVERSTNQDAVMVGEVPYTALQLREATNQIKGAIATIIEKRVPISVHRDFVNSLHEPVRVGRPPASRPVDYLVLNYDTMIEDALALEKIPYVDGIAGGATGWWDPDTFDRDGTCARVIKLHGSINWYELQDDPLPRRVGPNLKIQDEAEGRVLIWPASTKYREAQFDPFAQLANHARKAMQPHAGSQRLLVICGYSFGDKHINLEIDKALQESRGNLTVVAFTNDDEPAGQLEDWKNNVAVRNQVLIFANRGFFHGDTEQCSEDSLLWWKFENLTRILKG